MTTYRTLVPIVCVLAACSSPREAMDASRSDAADSLDIATSTDAFDTGTDAPPALDAMPIDDASTDVAAPSDAAMTDAATDALGPRRFWWNTEVIDPATAPDPIWGDGHVHSDFSGDGTHPALEMMNRAKDLGADFVWITDHARTPANSGGVSAAEFDVCTARGRDATDADQFAGCGVEYRLGYTRANGTHVYEAWHQIVHDIASDEFGEVLNVEGYTSWPAYHRDLARTSAYAIITHPSGPTAWYNDDDSAYRDTDPSNHPNTELLEVNGGDDDASNGNNMVDGINVYLRFLNDGWQVSPVWDSDMHQFYGGPEQAKGYGTWIDRAAQWAPSTYRAALRTAARRHSSFANHPGNQRNYIRMLSLAADGSPEALAGSTLPPRARLRLRVRANINNSDERWFFRLYTNRASRFDAPFMSAGAGATDVVMGGDVQQWEPSFPTDGITWVVAFASITNGSPSADTQYLVSAPIWLNDR